MIQLEYGLEWLANAAGVEVAAPVVVLVGIAIRIYAGSVLFHPRYARTWGIARSIGVPILNRVALGRLGVDIENQAHKNEYVGHTDTGVQELALALDTVGPTEVPLLAGYKSDWKGRDEAGTVVVYHGDRPFPTAPDWLRDRQTHLTVFADGDQIVVTAHEEANSYRPDQWADHLFKGSFSAERGVTHATQLLDEAGVELTTQA